MERKIGRPSKAEPFRSFVVELLAKEPDLLSVEILRRANTPGALTSMAVGLACFIAFKWITPEYPSDVIAVALAGTALVSVSLLTAKSHPPRGLTDLEGRPISLEGRLGLPGKRIKG